MTQKIITISFVIALFASVLTSAGANVKIEKVTHFNTPDCFKISNGTVEVIISSKIGPRIWAYQFVGGKNVLQEMDKSTVVKTEFGDWHPWGGSRIWHAPEAMPRSYETDNDPVEIKTSGNSVTAIQNIEPHTLILKEITVSLGDSGTEAVLVHKLTNKGQWPIELAPWVLTIMKPGGIEYIPQEPYISHDDKLLSARPLVLWNYSDMSDTRFTWGKKLIRLETDPKKDWPNKIGVGNTLGWTAYSLDGDLFVKRYPYKEGLTYPDGGCNFETYTSGTFLELESLGAMTKLEPGQSVTHTEHWYLFKDVKIPADEDDAVEVLEGIIKMTNAVK